ncbi:MAG: hypothetical protein ACT4OU_12855 [Hyphomicrobium sp.]
MGLLNKLVFPSLCLATVAASAWTFLTLDRWVRPSVVVADREGRASATASNAAPRIDRETPTHLPPRLAETIAALPDDPTAGEAPLASPSLPTLDAETHLDDEAMGAQASSWSLEEWTTETRREAAVAPAPGPRLLRGPVEVTRRPAPSVPTAASAPKDFTLKERLATISPAASRRLVMKFMEAGVAYPPADIGLVAIKDQKVVELHARSAGGEWKLVHQYKVLAASGGAGPKLAQGDKQVPEGVYGISFLNPNSRYHVALRVNYPNDFDRRMAEKDGRSNLGGDIMIHGKAVSIGCLAIGDAAAEELFVLADVTGLDRVKVVIAPTDFRRYGVPESDSSKPKWTPQLYAQVASAMSEFKPPPSVGLLSFFGKW